MHEDKRMDQEQTQWQAKPYIKHETPLISTNSVINLTCTLCAMSGALGLFFCFADKRSQAVRRYAVQSTALLFVYAIASVACYVIGAVLGVLPFMGGMLRAALQLVWAVLTVLNLVARIKMMFHAYAGEAYVLPLIGEHARTFE